jgi:hypothetical protein
MKADMFMSVKYAEFRISCASGKNKCYQIILNNRKIRKWVRQSYRT